MSQSITPSYAAAELNELHKSIEAKLRSTVKDAIRAGEILSEMKDRLPHGDFLPWIQAKCSFSQPTAWRYIKLYQHNDKLSNLNNLQDAYQQIETIERQEKQTEHQRARTRVEQFKSTGVKPDGWRRGTDDKILQEDREREERIRAETERARIMQERRRQEEIKKATADEALDVEVEWIAEAAAQIVQHHQKRLSFKDRIRLSDSGRDDAFVDALMDYLEDLDDDNRRIEACTNIIKVARNIAAELQREKQA